MGGVGRGSGWTPIFLTEAGTKRHLSSPEPKLWLASSQPLLLVNLFGKI